MPSQKLLPIFCSFGYNSSTILSAKQVREAVTLYVKANELVSANNPRLLNNRYHKVWDPVLCI